MDKKHICRYCGKEFKTAAKLGGHVSKCKLHPKYEQIINKIVETRKKNIDVKVYVFNCEVCNAEYTLKLNKNQYNDKSYKRTCSRHCASVLTARNTNKSIKNQKISKKVKLNNDAKPKKIKYCKLCGNVIDTNIRKHSSFCSDKCSKEHRHIALSKNAKLRKFGGYVPNSIKKYKHGIYNGIHYDSSWELAYIIYNLEHNIPIKRCVQFRTYINEDNKICNYIPDFEVNNEIIEIKGYFSENAKLKAKYNPDIKLILSKDMKKYLDYTINKYGKKFWENINRGISPLPDKE